MTTPEKKPPSSPSGHDIPRPSTSGFRAVPAPPSAPSDRASNVIPSAPRPPLVSDPAVAAIASEIQARVGSAHFDAEQSIEIAPPTHVESPETRAAKGAADPYIGTTFDHRYKIEKLLGEGGMGFVYLARHKVIDKKVAVKVLRSEMAKDREILDRFLQEAKAASSIGNPHIVDISDFGDLPDGSTYFVMEFLEGGALTDLVGEGKPRISTDKLCHVALQIADGLAAAHQRGIVHRDLKPDNIFLVARGGDPSFVKILDFGIAKVNGPGNTKLTKAGAVFGTPHYMSPEQAAGAPIDHRADIYALGVILYELASGQLPFNADNFMGILTQHMYKAPVPPRALVPSADVPPSLEAVILKCLQKKPDLRYQSMEELAGDLKICKDGGIPPAVAEMMARSGGFNVPHDFFKPAARAIVPATPHEPRKRWPTIVWVAGAVAAVGIVGVIFFVNNMSHAKSETTSPVGATPAATASPPSTAAATAAPTASAQAVKKTIVAVAATPKTAKMFRDGQSFELPGVVEVEDGKVVSIEVRADGFETAKVDLDGKEASKEIDLKPTVKPGALKSGGGKPMSSKCKKGETFNPWDCK